MPKHLRWFALNGFHGASSSCVPKANRGAPGERELTAEAMAHRTAAVNEEVLR